jgi:hypothetical protein
LTYSLILLAAVLISSPWRQAETNKQTNKQFCVIGVQRYIANIELHSVATGQ